MNDENEDTAGNTGGAGKTTERHHRGRGRGPDTLSAKAFIAHFKKRAPGEPLAKGLSKAALIAKIEALPPLAAPEPTPEPTPTPAPSRRPSVSLRTPPLMASTRGSCVKPYAPQGSGPHTP